MKIVFLDRDGVINTFPGLGNYVTKVKDFHILPGALEALKTLTQAGCQIFVISNQAGVGKGVYSKDKLQRINRKMLEAVKKVGGRIKKVYYCTHRSDANCACRKPRIGNIEKALRSLNHHLHKVDEKFFVGDTQMDVVAGKRAGCLTIFVLSGKDKRRDVRKWVVWPDFIAKDLKEAVKIILGDKKTRQGFRVKKSINKREKT